MLIAKQTGVNKDRRRAGSGITVVAAAVATLLAAQTLAGPREQAQRLYDRLAGVPPTAAMLDTMAADITGGNALTAAGRAMDDPAFYNVTLKNFVTPWTNRDQTVFAPLNDYTATVIGMVRDDVSFDTALSADLVYVVNDSSIPPYSPASNDHYAQAEINGIDLKSKLVARQQSAVMGIPVEATAGLITTRAAAAAFFVNGTNRAMFRFTLINHLCTDMGTVLDTTRPPDRIRQDVSRSPGGDSRIFLNNCIGCHSGMDPMAQAFAYYNFDNNSQQLVYTAGQVQPKYLINSDNFKTGFITPDNSWENRWRHGQNQIIGWSPSLPGSGAGAKSLGQELAASDAFAQCQVQKVFKAVCFRDPANATDRSKVAQIKADFVNGQYKMKQVFAETAVYCMGQ